jgi:hypothetical protein
LIFLSSSQSTPWQNDFTNLDNNPKNQILSYEEALPYLTSGINEFLANQRNLNTSLMFMQADINRDGTISIQEW